MDPQAVAPMEVEPLVGSRQRQTPFSSLRGGVEARKRARHQCTRRFLYSDLKPLSELGIAPDPHPEGPSSLPVEAPEDIRKELANERRREGLRKAAILKQLPRLTEAAAARDSLLKAAGHTTQGSQALRICQENAFVSAVQDGEALASVLEAQRHDLWFDRAKAERSDLGRESRMLDEAMRIIRGHEEVASLPRKSRGHTGEGSDRDSGPADPSVATSLASEASVQGSDSIVAKSATDPESVLLIPSTPENNSDGCDSSASTSSKIEEIVERQKMMQRLTEAQDLWTRAKTEATDLMFLADKADQEASKEETKLRDMQRAPFHSEEALFDSRVNQRRLWMAKNEVALQSRLHYQEAVEQLHRVQEEWGPALGVELSVASSSHTPHTAPSTTTSSSLEECVDHDSMEAPSEAVLSRRGGMANETICLWVIGVVAVNLSSETLSRAYYGCFSESALVPSSGWMAFDQGSTDITVHCVVPKKSRKGIPAQVDTWVVDGAPFPEVNGRYMERGRHDGVPRYRNSNNVFLFRHKLNRSEELGITRQTCLPESELVGDDTESAATIAGLSLGNEVSGKMAMNFSRLVKTSLQTINLDREERVRSNHQRIARAVAKIDEQFQQQMDQASATLEGVDRADSTLGGGLPHASTVSTTGADDNRDLAIMVASDSAKVSTS